MSNGKGNQEKNDEKKPFGIDFIDPLFAVALHIGLTEGIMRTEWFEKWHLPKGDDIFKLFTFLLGLLTVILSWVGYHESIRIKPLRGFVRFVLDVILVLLYAVLLVKFQNLGAALLLLVTIYLLFVIWDIFKVLEYSKKYDKQIAFLKRHWRERVTVVWCAFFIILYCIYYEGLLSPNLSLCLAYIITILYRIDKSRNIFGGIGTAIRDSAIGRRNDQ